MPLDLLLALLAIALAVNVVLIAGALVALRRAAARRSEQDRAISTTLPGTLPRDPGGEAWRTRPRPAAGQPEAGQPDVAATGAGAREPTPIGPPASEPSAVSREAAEPGLRDGRSSPAAAGDEPPPPPRARRSRTGRRATDRAAAGPGIAAAGRAGPRRAGRFTLPDHHDAEAERTERAIEAFLNGADHEDPQRGGQAMAEFEGLVGRALEGRIDREMSVVVVELDGLDRVAATVGPEAGAGLGAAVSDLLRRSAGSPDHVHELGPGSYRVALPGADGRSASAWVERAREACQPWLDVLPGDARFVAGWAHRSPRSSVGATVRAAHRRLERDRARTSGRARGS